MRQGREVVRAVMVLCTCVRCSVLCGVLVMLMVLCGGLMVKCSVVIVECCVLLCLFSVVFVSYWFGLIAIIEYCEACSVV